MFLTNNSSRFRDFGLFIIRFGMGVILAYVHGYGKITGGIDAWHQNGAAVSNLGIHFGYAFWGFMSAFAEFMGGIFIALGLLFRPFSIIVVINFIIATVTMLNVTTIDKASNAIVFLCVFLGLLITGPGKFSGDQLIGLNK